MTTAYIPGMIPEFDKADRLKKAITVSGVPVGEMAEYLGVRQETLPSIHLGRPALQRWAGRFCWQGQATSTTAPARGT